MPRTLRNDMEASHATSFATLDEPIGSDLRAVTSGSRGHASARGMDASEAKSTVHAHCGVYTDPGVVEMMLDLIGWTADASLIDARLLEPSCGDGAFVVEAARRLVRACRSTEASELRGSILAFEFEPATATLARENVVRALVGEGLGIVEAEDLASTWIMAEDFLTAPLEGTFSHVVGNPPYMRWSLVPEVLRVAYRCALPALAAKGDLSLGFVWRGMKILRPESGAMAFLCADRWLRCAYGAEVRAILSDSYALVAHVEVHGAPVFAGDRAVGAYAAVSMIRARAPSAMFFARATSIRELRGALNEAHARDRRPPAGRVAIAPSGIALVEPETAEALDILRARGAPLASAGVKVRCGLALGAAKIFIVDPAADIEADRLVPLVRSVDVSQDGEVTSCRCVINVWNDRGELVDLRHFPKLAAHLEPHRPQLLARACVSGENEWYRSIDKILPANLAEAKVLVVGMAKYARLGLEPGGRQHGNALYALTSRSWPTLALRRLLDAGVLELFGTALSPRFSGGTKRFDGHVLSQIHIPAWEAVPQEVRSDLLDPKILVNEHTVGAAYGVTGRRSSATLARALRASLFVGGGTTGSIGA